MEQRPLKRIWGTRLISSPMHWGALWRVWPPQLPHKQTNRCRMQKSSGMGVHSDQKINTNPIPPGLWILPHHVTLLLLTEPNLRARDRLLAEGGPTAIVIRNNFQINGTWRNREAIAWLDAQQRKQIPSCRLLPSLKAAKRTIQLPESPPRRRVTWHRPQ